MGVIGAGVGASPYFDVLEFKHVSLNKGATYLLIGPCDEELVVVVCLAMAGEGKRERGEEGERRI